jgi:Protein of unknown function (DUF2442)
MLVDVIEVRVLDGYKLFLHFENNVEGEIDISEIVPFKGIFERLKNKEEFSKVTINKEVGTICWENGADLSPCVLYEQISQKS